MRSLSLLLILVAISSVGRADIEWNGFGSVFVGKAFDKYFLPNGYTNTSADFGNFSLMGLNVSGKLDEKLNFASQLVAQNTKGSGEWAMTARWAFLKADFSQATVKFGRQLLPNLIASEFASVHYLLPYRAIPAQMQPLAGSSQFDGITVSHKFQMDSHDLTFSLFGGSPLLDPIPIEGVSIAGATKDLLGARLVFQGEGYQIQTTANRQSRDYTVTYKGTSAHYSGDVVSLTTGYRYDRGGFTSWGEWGYAKSDNGSPTTSLTPTPAFQSGNTLHYVSSGYVLLGYHLGPWLPRYTFANTQGSLGYSAEHAENAHTLGVNYQISPQATLKFDCEYIYLPDSSKGPTTATRPPVTFDTTSGKFTVPDGADSKSGSAIYLGLDFIF